MLRRDMPQMRAQRLTLPRVFFSALASTVARCRSTASRSTSGSGRSSSTGNGDRGSDGAATSGGRLSGWMTPSRDRDAGPFHGVLQFPNVARPVVGRAAPPSPAAKSAVPPRRAAHPVDEVSRQERNVFGPPAQRRQLDLDHVESIIQVFAQRPLGDQTPEAAGRGGDDAHVHLEVLRPADALEAPLLKEAEQPDL